MRGKEQNIAYKAAKKEYHGKREKMYLFRERQKHQDREDEGYGIDGIIADTTYVQKI